MATVVSQAIRSSDTGVLSRSAMTAALTPAEAITRLHDLSTDIRAAIVLDGGGERLAGSEGLAGPARALLDAGDAPAMEVACASGSVFSTRTDRHAIVLVAGRFALPSVMLYDLRVVLGQLEGRPR